MINDKSNNQNIDVQIFIIKQIERKDKQEFETRFKNFLNAKTSFSFKKIFNKESYKTDRRTSYLVPLIYDSNKFADTNLLPLFLKGTNEDFYYYNSSGGKANELNNTNVFINDNYISILKCPLLDYTKLAYVFQTTLNYNLGISDCISFNCQLNVHQPSNCSISLNNFNHKYNFTYEDDLINHNDIYKSVFDTDDIVILRTTKRADKKYKEQKFIDIYSNGVDDYFKTVFTGFINNVNESINWQSRSQTININCQGPSKRISYSRLITGQATTDKDQSTAIIPISCYSIPQAQGPDGKFTIDNESIIKNVIVRTLTSVDNIPACHSARYNFESNFNKLYNNENNNNEIGKNIQNYRKKYNEAIEKNFENFCFKDETNGFIEIYKNIFKKNNREDFLPIFRIVGTNQPGCQYAFNSFQQMFVANYETVYQFIKKIAENLEFNFYDDQYGVIHFELMDTDLFHLYDENDPNNFTQVISFSKEQNTDSINNIMPIYGNFEWAGLGEGQSLGLGAVVRDPYLIKKYGERPMSPRNIVGITEKKACERYGKNLMEKMNRKINSYSLSLIGDPSIKLGKYGYLKDFKKLFYVESLKHQYTAGSSLVTTLNGSYERLILLDVIDAIDNPFKVFNISEPDFKHLDDKEKRYAKFLYIKNKLNQSLQNLSIIDYKFALTFIFIGANLGNLRDKLIAELKRNFGYKNATKAEDERLIKLYSNKNLPFLYFDGYFWMHNFESNLYEQASSIQQLEIEKRKKKNKGITK